jgi:hypothetical protein
VVRAAFSTVSSRNLTIRPWPGDSILAGVRHGQRRDPTVPIRGVGGRLEAGGVHRHKAVQIGGLRFLSRRLRPRRDGTKDLPNSAILCHSSVTQLTRLARDQSPSGHALVSPAKRQSEPTRLANVWVSARHDELSLGGPTLAGLRHGLRCDPTVRIRGANGRLEAGGIHRHKARQILGLRFCDVGSKHGELGTGDLPKSCH